MAQITQLSYDFGARNGGKITGAPGSKTAPRAPQWVELMGSGRFERFLGPSKTGQSVNLGGGSEAGSGSEEGGRAARGINRFGWSLNNESELAGA